VVPRSAGIIRSELYKIRDTQTPYGVNVQTIVDVSVMLHSRAHCCTVFGGAWLLITLVSCGVYGSDCRLLPAAEHRQAAGHSVHGYGRPGHRPERHSQHCECPVLQSPVPALLRSTLT
jgi:hypothetical protein